MVWLSIPALLCASVLPLAAQCTIEIATVADLKGNWVDQTQRRPLIKNQVVCADSRVQRVNDARASASDFLKLSSRSDSTQPLTFECKSLLGCERPLDLGALVNEESRKLRGASVLESYASWRNSRNRTTSTMSRLVPPPATPVLKTVVIEAGRPIPSIEVFRAEAHAGRFQLDLCAQPTDETCGKTVPAPKEVYWQPGAGGELPFAAPSAGVHILYRLKDDDPELRTSDRVLVIAVDSSRADLITEARDKIAIAALSVSSSDAGQMAAFEDYVRSIDTRLATR